jgi:hypothetical protein
LTPSSASWTAMWVDFVGANSKFHHFLS